MVDLFRALGASDRRRLGGLDDERGLRRSSAIASFALATGSWTAIAAHGWLEPGSTARLVWAGAFFALAGVLVLVLPLRDLHPADLTLRLLAVTVLAYSIERDVPADARLLLLPLFVTAVIVPARFTGVIPTASTVVLILLVTGRVASDADASVAAALVAWTTTGVLTVLVAGVIRRLADERRTAERTAAALAGTDDLTGLPNRRHFMEVAPLLLLEAHDEQRPCTLVLLDVDHFKSVNDRHGHEGGDRVLVGVADALRGTCRSDDLIARLGGGEFAILMLGASGLHAQYVAADLASTLRAIEPVAITASYGAVEARHGELDIDELLARADAALDQAKRTGRDRCVVEA
jgi:diguanylate cyclase (GGDEF)-like protein